MDAGTRGQVRQRAGGRCEYCRLPDHAVDLPFHVEHIVASVHLRDDSFANLAWACPRCNLRKGPNLATVDPQTGEHVPLFNPRTMNWVEHFTVHAGVILGLSLIGRGTARLLDMNDSKRLEHRKALIEAREY